MRTLGILVALSLSAIAVAAPVALAECVGDRMLHACVADPDGNGVPNVYAAGANTPAGGAHAFAVGFGNGGMARACGGSPVGAGGCISASGVARDANGDGAPDVGHGGVHANGGAMGHRGGAGASLALVDTDHDGTADAIVVGGGTSETGGHRVIVPLP